MNTRSLKRISAAILDVICAPFRFANYHTRRALETYVGIPGIRSDIAILQYHASKQDKIRADTTQRLHNLTRDVGALADFQSHASQSTSRSERRANRENAEAIARMGATLRAVQTTIQQIRDHDRATSESASNLVKAALEAIEEQHARLAALEAANEHNARQGTRQSPDSVEFVRYVSAEELHAAIDDRIRIVIQQVVDARLDTLGNASKIGDIAATVARRVAASMIAQGTGNMRGARTGSGEAGNPTSAPISDPARPFDPFTR